MASAGSASLEMGDIVDGQERVGNCAGVRDACADAFARWRGGEAAAGQRLCNGRTWDIKTASAGAC
jgi:hypothetical protein